MRRQREMRGDLYERVHSTEELIGQTGESKTTPRAHKRELRRAKQRRRNEQKKIERENAAPIHRKQGIFDDEGDIFDSDNPFHEN